jgi:hypothetical protein
MAWTLSGESGGGDNGAALAYLLGVPEEAVAEMYADALRVAADRVERALDLGQDHTHGTSPLTIAMAQTLLTGVELGVAAERVRARSVAS